jgi:hypothetical protein
MAATGTIESVLLEVDEKEVWVDGVDYYFLVQYDPNAKRAFIRWTPVNQETLGEPLEILPSQIPDALKHPTFYWVALPAKS